MANGQKQADASTGRTQHRHQRGEIGPLRSLHRHQYQQRVHRRWQRDAQRIDEAEQEDAPRPECDQRRNDFRKQFPASNDTPLPIDSIVGRTPSSAPDPLVRLFVFEQTGRGATAGQGPAPHRPQIMSANDFRSL